MELLNKRRDTANNYELKENELVKNAIESCGGLPLAISVLGALNLKTDDDWQNFITNNTIVNIDLQSERLLPDYPKSVYGTLNSAVDKLSERDKKLYRLLGVFKAVNIPVESIIALWEPQLKNTDRSIVNTKLKMLHQKSLLIFSDVDR